MPSPREKLISSLQSLCQKYNLSWDDDLLNDIPRRWRIHTDMLLLPVTRAFVDYRWKQNIRLFFH